MDAERNAGLMVDAREVRALREEYVRNDLRNASVGYWMHTNREILKTRLLDLSEPLHSAVDRPDAEATFRMALWPPLAAVAIYLAAVLSSWWLTLLALPVLLAWQWVFLRRRANDAPVTAIAARTELAQEFVNAVRQSVDEAMPDHVEALDRYERDLEERPDTFGEPSWHSVDVGRRFALKLGQEGLLIQIGHQGYSLRRRPRI